MDLNEYILPLKKWWWLLVAAAVVSGATSLGVAFMQPKVYLSQTTLMVGQSIDNPNPTSGDFYLEQSLAAAYADMAYREPVQSATMEALGLTWLPDYVAQVGSNSQLILIQVTDTDPVRAQRVAAELANQLILSSPTTSQASDNDRQAFINSQLDNLESQITSTEADITQLQQQLGDLTSAKQISDTQTQINALQAKLATLQGNYANLLSNTDKGALNSLSIIEPAQLPTSPVGQSKLKTALMSVVIGLFLAAVGAYAIEFFDRTIKTAKQVDEIFHAPVIGYIAEMEGKGHEEIIFKEHPRSLFVEAFRSIKGNIDLANCEKPIRTLLVTSVEAASGKTTVAANLAFAYSQDQRRVLLLDADLHKPRIHKILSLPRSPGLSDILKVQNSLVTDVAPIEINTYLKVMTAGDHLDAAVGYDLQKINRFFDLVSNRGSIVIIDAPPLLVSDAAVLASKVDGVILVIRPGRTPIDMAQATLEQLKRSGSRLVGVVFNRITRSQAEVYQSNPYYSPYHAYSSYLQSSAPVQEDEPVPQNELENEDTGEGVNAVKRTG